MPIVLDVAPLHRREEDEPPSLGRTAAAVTAGVVPPLALTAIGGTLGGIVAGPPGALVGAGIGGFIGGFGGDVAAQAVAAPSRDPDLRESLVAGAFSALPLGELAAVGRGARVGIRAAQAGALGAGESIARDVVTGRPVDPGRAVLAGGLGAALGGVGGAVEGRLRPGLTARLEDEATQAEFFSIERMKQIESLGLPEIRPEQTDRELARILRESMESPDPLGRAGAALRPARHLGAQQGEGSGLLSARDPESLTQSILRNFSETETDVLPSERELVNRAALLNRDLVGLERRNRVPIAQTQRDAESLLEVVRRTARAEPGAFRARGQALNAEQLTAFTVVDRQLTDEMFEAFDIYRRTGADQDLATAAVAARVKVAHMAETAGATAEAGRALRILREVGKGDPGSAGYRNRFVRASFKRLGSKEKVVEFFERLAKIDPEDWPTINRLVLTMEQATTADKVFEFWINGLLSGIGTNTINTVGNGLNALGRPLFALGSAAIDAPLALAGGRGRQRFFGEAAADMAGMYRGLRYGVWSALRAVSREVPTDTAKILETGQRFAIKGPLGRVVRAPSTLLTASDEFFKAINFEGSLSALAYRRAAEEGLSGQAFANRMSQIIEDPKTVPEVGQGATFERLRAVFQLPGGKAVAALKQLRDAVPGARYLLPFLRTPANILKTGFRPFTVWGDIAELARTGRLGEAPDELLLGFLGTATAGAVAMGVLEGKITGGGPLDPKVRRLWNADGRIPYAVRIGDQWVQYGRLDPLATFLGSVADLVELGALAEEEDGLGQAAQTAVLGFGQQLQNKTFLRGLEQLFAALHEPESRDGKKFIASLVSAPLVGLSAGLARGIDAAPRVTATGGELLRSRIPGDLDIPGLGRRSDLRPIRDVWGRPLLNPQSSIERFASPIQRRLYPEDPATREIIRTGYAPGSPLHSIGPAELTEAEYDRYVALSGALAQRSVTALISSGAYRVAPEARKHELLDDAFTTARKAARGELLATRPALRARVATAERSRRFLPADAVQFPGSRGGLVERLLATRPGS